jgi:hypothetical protein
MLMYTIPLVPGETHHHDALSSFRGVRFTQTVLAVLQTSQTSHNLLHNCLCSTFNYLPVGLSIRSIASQEPGTMFPHTLPDVRQSDASPQQPAHLAHVNLSNIASPTVFHFLLLILATSAIDCLSNVQSPGHTTPKDTTGKREQRVMLLIPTVTKVWKALQRQTIKVMSGRDHSVEEGIIYRLLGRVNQRLVYLHRNP